jgi:hypothetical protein
MAATYVNISRDEFESWLDETWGRGNWNIREGSVGVYRLRLGPRVSIEVSSSIGSRDENLSRGRAAIHTKLVSRRYGRAVNKKAAGQSRVNRTTNWRKSLEKVIRNFVREYVDRRYFYEAIADQDRYKQEVIGMIEQNVGWQDNAFFKSIHDQVSGGRVLTEKQARAVGWVLPPLKLPRGM